MPVVCIDENIPLLKLALPESCDIIEFPGRKLTNADLIESKCEYLFVRSTTKVNAELIKHTNVKFVATATAGTDHFDTKTLEDNNIYYVSAPGCNANSVAEYIVFCILKSAFDFGIELDKSIIGIIGFGHVGSIVAEYAAAMKIKVLVNDPPLKDRNFKFPEYCEYADDLNKLIKSVNILTNHVPLIRNGKYQTINLLNENNLKYLPANSILLHASRGSVVNELTVLDLYKTKNIRYFVDVYSNEPYFDDGIALNAEIATPHIAGYSRNGKLNGSLMLAKQFEKFSGLKVNLSIFENELNNKVIQKSNREYFSDLHMLFDTLKKIRNIEDDSDKFKLLIGKEREEKKLCFDILRKQYPVRYETLSHKII